MQNLKYPKLTRRLKAILFEVLLWTPMIALFIYFEESGNKTQDISSEVIGALLGTGYILFFHSKFGQDLGKMIAKIKIVSIDGSKMTFKKALLRNSAYILLDLTLLTSIISAILKVPQEIYNYSKFDSSSTEYDIYFESLEKAGPLTDPILIIAVIWIACDLFTIIYSKNNRAIHDFIAGTVVIESNTANEKFNQKDSKKT